MKTKLIPAALVALTITSACAQTTTLSSVKTRIGTLKFEKGFPTEETARKLFEEVSYQRNRASQLVGLSGGFRSNPSGWANPTSASSKTASTSGHERLDGRQHEGRLEDHLPGEKQMNRIQQEQAEIAESFPPRSPLSPVQNLGSSPLRRHASLI